MLLLGYIIYQRIHSRAINRQLSQVRQEIDSLNQEEAQARAILNKPQNSDVADQSEFLNQLFARKALSWTRVFTEMERIMPFDLHVVSMKPEYSKTNDLMLRVVVATGSRDRAVELVRRMEKSNHFRQAEIVAENVTANVGDQSAGPGNIQFDIAAVYLPGARHGYRRRSHRRERQEVWPTAKDRRCRQVIRQHGRALQAPASGANSPARRRTSHVLCGRGEH